MSGTYTQYSRVLLQWTPPVGAIGMQVVVTAPDGSTQTLLATTASALPNMWTAYYGVAFAGAYTLEWQVLDATGTPTGQMYADSFTSVAYVESTLLSLEDCLKSLNADRSSFTADQLADMPFYAAAATALIEDTISAPVVPRVITEAFDGGNLSVKLSKRYLSIVSVVENGVQIFDWVADPIGNLIRAGTMWWNRPFWPGQQNVYITYEAGLARVPQNVYLATRELFRHLWQLGRQGSFDPTAAMNDANPATTFGYALPNRVVQLLGKQPMMPGFA